MTATHYPASLSGPAERKLDLDCKRCHGVGAARANCRECGEPVCYSCLVACASCAAMDEGEPVCVACAPRVGLTKVGGLWLCENDAPEIAA
jgi:hypothetical protein